MKKIGCFLLAFLLLLFAVPISSIAENTGYTLSVKAKSAFLMDYDTGTVLFEQNADERLPLASVTKIMTLLLVMEALEDGRIHLEEMVTASEHAASMGGSQIDLEVGEQMSVNDLIKSVVIASANDAAAALAEHIAGSEEAFVAAMNEKAASLGMLNTHFENTNGLDDTTTAHYSSARDIAIMSRELMRHPKILEYSGIWMDTIRNGEFGLTNTNRLIRFYPGATGLKTGSTEKAKFCISATALRDGMHLIAVVMGAESRDIRNEETKKLLDYGFANYGIYHGKTGTLEPVKVIGGSRDTLQIKAEDLSAILGKGESGRVTVRYNIPSELSAPIYEGDVVGSVEYVSNGEVVLKTDIIAAEDVTRISYFGVLTRMLKKLLIS